MDSQKVVELIKDLRVKKKIKQEDIARFLGLSKSQYSNYETGKSEMTLQTFFKILEVLKIDVKDFFEISEYKISKEDITDLIEVIHRIQEKL